jgi:putative phage-type endonuclease
MNQGSPEWYAARRGKVTASRIADVIARTKTGWGASRANYMAELLVERLTGQSEPGYTSAAMQWGTEQEPNARAAYEFYVDCDVEAAAFVPHPAIAAAGASPDGLVGIGGLVEIKCPNTATHIDTLLDDGIPAKYADQMQWQMACTGRAWCDFVSFDPRMPEPMRLFVRRVERDAARIGFLEGAVVEFLAELDAKEAALRARYEPAAKEAA